MCGLDGARLGAGAKDVCHLDRRPLGPPGESRPRPATADFSLPGAVRAPVYLLIVIPGAVGIAVYLFGVILWLG